MPRVEKFFDHAGCELTGFRVRTLRAYYANIDMKGVDCRIFKCKNARPVVVSLKVQASLINEARLWRAFCL